MSIVRAEMSIEPWHEGEPGPHVIAALEAGKDDRLEPELDAFAITMEGTIDEVTERLRCAAVASVGQGATRLAISLTVQPPLDHPIVKTAQKLAESVGGRLVPVAEIGPGDVVVEHDGEVLAGIHTPSLDLDGALQRLVDEVEGHFESDLTELSRADKQAALVMLEERGAFKLRNAAEELAELLGVSRVTLYNYLNQVRATE